MANISNDYVILRYIPIPQSDGKTVQRTVAGAVGDVICMPLITGRTSSKYTRTTLKSYALESNVNAIYAWVSGDTSTHHYGYVFSGYYDGTDISEYGTAFFDNSPYSKGGGDDYGGAINPALIKKDSVIHTTLRDTFSATFSDAGVIKKGSYVIKSLGDISGLVPKCDLYRNYNSESYGARMYYPLRNVTINGVYYRYIAPYTSHSYSNTGNPFDSETFSLSTLLGWKGTSSTAEQVTLNVGDIIRTSDYDVLLGWAEWFDANTEPAKDIEIIYNESMTSILAGQTATLPCGKKVVKNNISIVANIDGSFTYNGVTTNMTEKSVVTLTCADKFMKSDVTVTAATE